MRLRARPHAFHVEHPAGDSARNLNSARDRGRPSGEGATLLVDAQMGRGVQRPNRESTLDARLPPWRVGCGQVPHVRADSTQASGFAQFEVNSKKRVNTADAAPFLGQLTADAPTHKWCQSCRTHTRRCMRIRLCESPAASAGGAARRRIGVRRARRKTAVAPICPGRKPASTLAPMGGPVSDGRMATSAEEKLLARSAARASESAGRTAAVTLPCDAAGRPAAALTPASVARALQSDRLLSIPLRFLREQPAVRSKCSRCRG